jgi:hypothetical protein
LPASWNSTYPAHTKQRGAVKVFVILDRDYYTPGEISRTAEELTKKGVHVHVWSRKEIENYLIDFGVLHRILSAKFAEKGVTANLDRAAFDAKLISLLEELREDSMSQILSRTLGDHENKGLDHSTVIKETIADFGKNWENLEFRIGIVSGKEFFAKLNTWLGQAFGLSISVGQVVRAIQTAEICSEVAGVVREFLNFAGMKPLSQREFPFDGATREIPGT